MADIDNIDKRPRRSGVQSIEIGGDLLEAMVALGRPAKLSEISKAAGLQSAKAHRYLTSLCEIGLTLQHSHSGRYGLGPLALRMGLSAIAQYDIIERAYEVLVEVCDDLKTSGHMSVWSDAGPVVIRSTHGGPPVISPVSVGTILPLRRSATGLVYLSYMAEAATADALRKQGVARAPDEEEVATIRDRVTRDGCAFAEGQYIPGLCAVAFPILNHDDSLAGAITLVSTDQSYFTSQSRATQRISEAVAALHKERATT